MRKFLILLSVIIAAKEINAQNNNEHPLPKPNFEALKLNSSPSYILLGIEPENIQRPTSPTQFMGGVQNSIINGKLKPNVAFEFTPYFWKNPKKDSLRFKIEEVILPEKNIFKSIAKTATFSIATSESDTVAFGKLKPGTGFGTGVRFILIDGKPQGENMNRLFLWNRLIHKQSLLGTIANNIDSKDEDVKNETIINNAISNYIKGIGNNKSLYNLGGLYNVKEFIEEIEAEIKKVEHLKDGDFVASLNKVIETEHQKEAEILKEINKNKLPFAKTGFILELAAGAAFVFQESAFNAGKYAKSAIWLTPSYRWQVNKDGENISLLDWAGVLRFTFNNKKDSIDISDFFDAGTKLQFTHNRWSCSLEGVLRYATKTPSTVKRNYTYRFVSSIDYKITDAITFKFSFGTNFDGNTKTYSDPKQMFAVGGINLGIFNPKK
jgi:hypothetical protein